MNKPRRYTCHAHHSLKTMQLESPTYRKIVAGATLAACIVSAHAVENGEILHDQAISGWSPIEGVSHGPAPGDWTYSRRHGSSLEIFLSRETCLHWSSKTKVLSRRLTINGRPPKGNGACNAGVNKLVLANFFPPPLPELPGSGAPFRRDAGVPLPGLDPR